MAQVGIEPSLGSVGDSCDNTLAATINGLYKAGSSIAVGDGAAWKPWSSRR